MREFKILLLLIILLFFPVLAYGQPPPEERSLNISATVEEITPEPPPPSGGGGGGPVISYATVVFEGRAYPGAFLTLLKNNKVAATFTAKSSGLFTKKLTGIAGGIYSFGIFAEDTEGRKSVTLGFTISILGGKTTTVSGIFLSPTISLSATQVEIGESVNISGQVFPESKVNIFISSKEMVKETKASRQGKWNYLLNTNALEISEHEVKSMALFGEGEQSLFSQTLYFLVLKKGAMVCQGVDLNFDGKVNIVDFSILLYFWNKTQPSNHCVDINFDGIVNIFDFSIMMYWWGG